MDKIILLSSKMQNLFINSPYGNYYLMGSLNKNIYLNHLNLISKKYDSSYSLINWTISFALDSKREQLLLFRNNMFFPKSYLIPEEIDMIDISSKKFFKEEKSSSGSGIYLELNQKVGLAQESIEPYLFRNKKIDNRVYVISLKINEKLYCYMYNEILVRSSQNFYLELSKNKLTQITNTAALSKENISSNQYLLSNLPFHELFFKKIIITIENICKIILNKYNIYNNTFNLYGFDIIIDKNGNPYLLEINSNPNFLKSLNTEEIKEMKIKMLNDIVYNLIPCILNNNLLLIKNFTRVY